MKNSLDIVGIRLVKERELYSSKPISSPKDAIEVIANELMYQDREILMTVNLNVKNQIINAHVAAVGGIDSSIVDVKNIYKSALLSNASKILLFHNHPSGECIPSNDDIKLTHVLDKGCHLLGMNILDHIVIGKNEYYSIKASQRFQIDLDFDEEMSMEI